MMKKGREQVLSKDFRGVVGNKKRGPEKRLKGKEGGELYMWGKRRRTPILTKKNSHFPEKDGVFQ